MDKNLRKLAQKEENKSPLNLEESFKFHMQ